MVDYTTVLQKDLCSSPYKEKKGKRKILVMGAPSPHALSHPLHPQQLCVAEFEVHRNAVWKTWDHWQRVLLLIVL